MRIVHIPAIQKEADEEQFPAAPPAAAADPEPEPIPAPAPVMAPPAPVAAPIPAPILDLRPLTDLKEQLQGLQATFEKAQAISIEQLTKNTLTITLLADEISALRKAVSELPTQIAQSIPAPVVPAPIIIQAKEPEPKPEPIPVAQPKPVPPLEPATISAAPAPVAVERHAPTELLDALAGFADEEKPKTKVAIFRKLWDYLNGVAFEVPLRKSDRTN